MPHQSKPVILHFVTWYPASERDIAGIFTRRHIELLATDKSMTHIVVKKSVEKLSVLRGLLNLFVFFKQVKTGTVPIIELANESFLYNKFFWRYTKEIEQVQLNRLINKYQPALLHLHVVYGFGKEAVTIKKKWGIPFVISEHMAPFPFEWIADKQVVIAEPMQEAAAVVAVSKAQAQQIKAFTGVSPIVIPNVVNEEEFFYREQQKTSGGFQLVLAGIYDSRKGADYLLHVLPAFLETYPDSVIHLVGEASAERVAALKQIMKEGSIEQSVVFHGTLTAGALCKLYHQCDFYVCASDWESFGLTMLEALFAGLPLLSTNCGGVLEFINEENGLLINNDRKEETLLNGLLQMTNQLSAFNRQAISASANKQFAGSIIKDKYYSLYKQVLKKADLRSAV